MFLCHVLREKDSKSRTMTNLSPGLIRAYGCTDGHDVITKFSRLDGFTNFIGMDAPPAGAFGARGGSATKQIVFQFKLVHRGLGTIVFLKKKESE